MAKYLDYYYYLLHCNTTGIIYLTIFGCGIILLLNILLFYIVSIHKKKLISVWYRKPFFNVGGIALLTSLLYNIVGVVGIIFALQYANQKITPVQQKYLIELLKNQPAKDRPSVININNMQYCLILYNRKHQLAPHYDGLQQKSSHAVVHSKHE